MVQTVCCRRNDNRISNLSQYLGGLPSASKSVAEHVCRHARGGYAPLFISQNIRTTPEQAAPCGGAGKLQRSSDADHGSTGKWVLAFPMELVRGLKAHGTAAARHRSPGAGLWRPFQ